MAAQSVMLDDDLPAEQAALQHQVEHLPLQLDQLANPCWSHGGGDQVQAAQQLAVCLELESQKLQLQEQVRALSLEQPAG
jgi:hypothetical protein